MKLLLTFFLSFLLFLASTKDSHAIIVIVPVVLIPVVQIVALIIGAIATPVIGFSAWYLKLKNKKIIHGVLMGLLILVFIALLITLGIKIANPNRPIF